MEQQEFRGWDPYDGLLSPLFSLPLLRSHRKIRFYAQQAIKRSPVNLRPVLGVPKSINPVTLGLTIHALTSLANANPESSGSYQQKVISHVDQLKNLSPFYNPNLNIITTQNSRLKTQDYYHGACWGYNFPWEARYASIPAYQPTVVATSIITNGLFAAWKVFGLDECRELCFSASQFVLQDLNRTYDGEDCCFSYSPFDHQQVLNANMKGVRVLLQAAACNSVDRKMISVDNENPMLQGAASAVRFVLRHQKPDGSFPYSLAPGGGWVDNYHTGYLLDGLDEYRKYTGDASVKPAIEKGFDYFMSHFLAEVDHNNPVNSRLKTQDSRLLIPRFYDNQTYPVDCTAAAQTILTLSRFGETDKAMAVANYMIEKMQSEKGNFSYRQITASRILQTDFIRWSDAWMLMALSTLLRR